MTYPDHYSVTVGDRVRDDEGFLGVVTLCPGDSQDVFVKLDCGRTVKYPYIKLTQVGFDAEAAETARAERKQAMMDGTWPV